jgi:hypothetical protein
MTTAFSKEPKVAKNAVAFTSRVETKFHFPGDIRTLERQIRISLALPFKGRMGGQVAYGYVYNTASDTYLPIPEIFNLLWQARRYLYTSSLREVCDWLNFKVSKLGFKDKLSHMGLRNIMILRPPYEECMLPEKEKEQILLSLCQWNQIHQK